MFLGCPPNKVPSWATQNGRQDSHPRVPTVWRVRQGDKSWRTYSIRQLQDCWEKQEEVERDEWMSQGGLLYELRLQAALPTSPITSSSNRPDSKETILDGSGDFEGMTTGLTTFLFFPLLPAEVRNTIWKEVLEVPKEPCHFEVIDKGELVFVPNITRVLVLLQISREARYIGLNHYQALPTTKGITYFDHQRDTICFGYSCWYGVNAMKWLAENNCVWYLEFSLLRWPVWTRTSGPPFFHTLVQNNELKEVTFFADTYGSNSLELFRLIQVKFKEIGKVRELKFVVRKRTGDTYRDEHVKLDE